MDERAPTFVARVVERDYHGRIAAGLAGLGQELHICLVWSASALARVALETTADDVLPSCFSAVRARDNVIKAELTHGSRLTAILTTMIVPGKQILAVETYRAYWNPIIARQSHDSRDLQFKIYGLVVVLASLLFERVNLADFAP